MTEAANTLGEAAHAGHRGHVTLFFSDLCDYTALSEVVDVEEADAIRSQLEALVDAIVQKHTGQITQVYGDGQLCVFGFPQPREDDVRRSIDAALELHAAVRAAQWSGLPHGFELRLHTGIHTGLVFLRQGTQLHGRYLLTGDVVNTTARLCSVAQRDEILVSAAAFSGSEHFYESTPVPPLLLKGKRLPQDAYRVTGRSNVRTRFEASTRRGLTTFVNRHVELGALVEGVRDSLAGRGRLLVVTGAAGIGKTRLLEEFTLRAADMGARVLRGTCENYGESVPLEPFSQILRQVFGIAASMPTPEAVAFVERQCALLGASVSAELSILLRLMALQSAHRGELASARVVQALCTLIETLAGDRPLTVILDDWQWADDASRAVLGQLQRVISERGACIVVGMRAAELGDPTLQPDHLLGLQPLTDSDGGKVIAALRPHDLSLGIAEVVLRRAGGNPLFLEELCRALPRGPLDERRLLGPLEVPSTVQGVIQTRVASLPDADLALLRTAAVIGMEFSVSMLAQVCEAFEHELLARLDALRRDDLIYQSGASDSYRFKHGLTREVVYESVLMAERRQLHARVAAALEREAAAGRAGAQAAEALAYHYRGSGDFERAAQYAELAGDRAMAVSALDRARYHYLAALTALDALPGSAESRQRWLGISAKWALPFVFSPVRSQLEVLHKAIAYADENGDARSKAHAWHWLGWAHYALGDCAQSIQHYRAALDLSEHGGDSRLVAQLVSGLGQSQAAAGDYPQALEHLARGIERKRTQARAQPARRDRIAQGFAYALGCMALVRADRGEFVLAGEQFAEALALVAGKDHAIEGSVLGLQCIAQLWRGDWRAALDTAQRNRKNAQRVNSAFSFAISSSFEAYASWQLSRASGGWEHVQRMRSRVDWLEAQQLELFASLNYAWLAEALAAHGEYAAAQRYVERALARGRGGDVLGDAMAYRVLARLAPGAGAETEHVEACLERAQRAGEARASRHEAAKTLLLRAELASDAEAARACAEASAVELQALGMDQHLERAEQLLLQAQAKR